MKELPNKMRLFGLIAISLFLYYCLAYQVQRQELLTLLISFLILFSSYFLLITRFKELKIKHFMILALVFRLIFLFATPALSDDYFRFIWDGQLMNLGYNPFDLIPQEVQVSFPNKEYLLEMMNSPFYYTIYPPVAQSIYAIAVFLAPNSILGAVVYMRLFILLAEIGIIMYLPKVLQEFGFNPKKSLWYLLNPLVIVELTGNLHMEGIMLFFFLLAIYHIRKNRLELSALFWALAAATKLIPLVFLPMIWRVLSFKKLALHYGLTLLIFLLLWLYWYNSTLAPHFLSSFDLYFKSFEFNASIYYVLRWMGIQITGYNLIAIIGVILPKIVLGLMLILFLRKQNRDWKRLMESTFFALSVYYLFASIVHPWYIVNLLFLGLFTRFNSAILWSALVLLSYAAYQTESYTENPYLIAIEYILLFIFFAFEFLKKPQFHTLDSNSRK